MNRAMRVAAAHLERLARLDLIQGALNQQVRAPVDPERPQIKLR
jgi:hypothetical protein